MKNFKKILSVFIVLCLTALLFAGCAGSKNDNTASPGNNQSTQKVDEKPDTSKKKIVLKIANYFAESHPQNIALKEVFKPMVEKETNGAIEVQIYPNNQLGAEKEFIDGTKAGSIEMNIMGLMLSSQFPNLKVMEFPYLFDNPDQGYEILNDHIFDDVTKGLPEKAGLRILGFNINGVRAISNSKRPINSLEDCQGLKLRVPQVKHFVEMGKALGFSVVTMPYSEIFTALQQGVVDGQENPPTTVLASGWYEAQKYIALTDHIVAYNAVTINEKFYQSLSKEQQEIIKKAVKAFCDEELKLYKEGAQKDIETLKEKGIVFTTPDREPFKQAVLPMYDTVLKETPEAMELIKKIWDIQKKMGN
ncbi:MAG: TRAP-type transport system periplasmic protein [Clostridiales bacterium]|jgi:tripartite ATP-independent transporter DctP family solute receptor|nr:TRAP-type transport system periplasmic protein [Clostridiales bacterium]